MRSVLALLGVACTPYDPDLGLSPYQCAAAEPLCPEGYTCLAGDCVQGSSSDASSFACNDDSGFGNNDQFGMAFPTPVGNQAAFQLASAICPETDRDHYKIDIQAVGPTNPACDVDGCNIEVVAFWDTGSGINISLLNSTGTSISNGAPTTVDDDGVEREGTRLCVPNATPGFYYALAFAASGLKNNYQMTIKLVPNC